MKKLLGILLGIVALVTAVITTLYLKFKKTSRTNLAKLNETYELHIGDLTFRDLNGNGRLDPYEDPRQPIDVRVEDLLSQMTLAEKVGLMFHPMIDAGKNGDVSEMPSMFSPIGTSEMVVNRHINHFNIVRSHSVEVIATWMNNLQKMAEQTRLGIPATISTDPRHAEGNNPGAGVLMAEFSHWPDPLGFGAAGDEALVEQFGDIARQEYIALGIRSALHPMADLATEPRWARIAGTFGEDAELVKKLTAAYIRGFQGKAIGPESVACMVKHFPGGGPQKDGWDPHFSYGRDQAYPGDNFDYHLIPFEGAFAAGVEQVMPYYGIPVGQTSEDVAMGYNKEILDLLRNKFGFEGIICADWQIVEPLVSIGSKKVMEETAWGVEHLPIKERYLKAVNAGIDQFGGQNNPQYIVELVEEGVLPEAHIDASARRILRLKFKLGLFDNPYVDVATAAQKVGTAEFKEAGLNAQRRSVVLLKNDGVLPLNGRPKLYVENMDTAVAAQFGDVVKKAKDADFAILRLETPYEKPLGKNFLERFFHQGDLDFKGKEKARILKILETTPTIVDIHLERGAVIPEIAGKCAGLLATFGAADEIVLEAVFGKFNPSGKLPIEMPSSMEAVRQQREDVPSDSENPLFVVGHGLSYPD